MLYWVAFAPAYVHIKTVIGRVTYEFGAHAILNSFCAGLCSLIKTVIGRVTYGIGVHAILESFCAGFCSHIKMVD